MSRRIAFAAVFVIYVSVGIVAFVQFRKMNTAFPTFGVTADISLTSPDYDIYLPAEETETSETVQETTPAETEAPENISVEYTFTAVHGEGRLFVREAPSMSAAILGSLSPGDGGDVLELGDDWALITSGDLTGYVSTQYLELSEAE